MGADTTIDCDLLVVGGGINGAGIARDAAGRGLSVVLCEKDDLGAHTSSASSKLNGSKIPASASAFRALESDSAGDGLLAGVVPFFLCNLWMRPNFDFCFFSAYVRF